MVLENGQFVGVKSMRKIGYGAKSPPAHDASSESLFPVHFPFHFEFRLLCMLPAFICLFIPSFSEY